MIITRGTRGDVQPFMALARGMAEKRGWVVTIVTELPYRDFVKSLSKVERGRINFRPSGGDTTKKIDKPLNQWAIKHKSEVMQAAILARSEANFFDSEPLIFHWAATLKPSLLIYGFTMAACTMTISEALRIPLIGFILQPTCIPSAEYPAVVALRHSGMNLLGTVEAIAAGHTAQTAMKFVLERTPGSDTLNDLRARRGLRKYNSMVIGSYERLVKRDYPMIIPIEQKIFGGKPKEWNTKAVLTDFIFLRTAAVPELSPQFKAFIADAKAANAPIVVMGFSSMPIPRNKIMRIAASMATETDRKPRVIALVGHNAKPEGKTPVDPLEEAFEAHLRSLKDESRILEAAGAPFGRLFPEVDMIIIHGGLGTTAEALRAGVPVIVTGVLLMDQRFWGQRIKDLDVGPSPIHIDDFAQHAVGLTNEALRPDSDWAKNAALVAEQMNDQIQQQMKLNGGSDDGVEINIKMLEELTQDNRAYSSNKLG